MLLLLQPRDQPWARVNALGTVCGPGTSLCGYAGGTSYLQCLGFNFVCFSTNWHYQHLLPLLTRLSLHPLLSETPWKILAHLQDLGALNVRVMCRQLTPQ